MQMQFFKMLKINMKTSQKRLSEFTILKTNKVRLSLISKYPKNQVLDHLLILKKKLQEKIALD